MKKFLLTLFAFTAMFTAKAVVNVDFSSRFEEGTNTIQCLSSWGWHSTSVKNLEIEECDYLYISYDATCNFNLIIRDLEWETAYSVTCKTTEKEAIIRLDAVKKAFTDIVIQNHSEGEITINKLYFCTEQEYLYPDPQEMEEARQNLSRTYLHYFNLSGGMEPGEDYGQYPKDLYEAFQNALEAALILDDATQNYGYDLTVEQINAMSHAIVDTYLALAAAKHIYAPADGYYYFVCARQFYNEDETTGETTYHTKAMYSKPSGENGWKNFDPQDPAFLWLIKRQEDNTYQLVNPANGLTFTSAANCTNGTAYIAIDPITKVDGSYATTWPLSSEEDITMFNFRMSTEKADDYKYVHMNWHNQGQGWEGPMTVWCNTTNDSGASEWYIEPVDQEQALALLNDKAYLRDFTQALEDAKTKVAIANDKKKEILITDATQFSSPFSQNDLGGRDGGDLSNGVLIDSNNSTYWHTYWEGGNVEPGVHYLQVELPEPAHGLIELQVTRRSASDDNVTQWGIYGSDYPNGEKYDYEWIADVDMPYDVKGESKTATFTIPEDRQYQYLRFYAEATNSNRGYWHAAEFQLIALSENPNSQAVAMGEVYTNMVEAIATAEAIDLNNLTRADYESFKQAYDPFIAMFVDPSTLNDAIAAAESALSLCVEGDNPGQWAAEVLAEVTKTIEDAKAYYEAGKYTYQQVQEYLAKLGNGSDLVMTTANRVSPDKYYTIRFASQETYNEQAWSTSNVEDSDFGVLYDTYLCPADAETLASTAALEVRQGSYMFFTDDDKADIAFRFVPVGDNTYIIQHQATGLFVQCYGHDSWTALTLTPTLFTVEPVGYGENIIRGRDYAGKDMACLHAQLRDHRLVTWHDDYAGCNSGLLIQELQTQEQPGSPIADYKSGELTTLCYPVSVEVSEGRLFTVAGTYNADDKLYVALNEVRSAAAGQPVIYQAEGNYDAENENDLRTVTLTVGTTLATEPQNSGALQGTYASLDLEEEAVIFSGNSCQTSTDETAHVSSNHAYLLPDKVQADPAATYSLVIEVNGDLTAMSRVLSDLTHRGNVYDAAGHLIRNGATLSDIKTLPRGLYILHGTKIFVK